MAMTPEQEQVWVLWSQGLTQEEIAREIGVTRKTVERRIARAKRWHQEKQIEGYGYEISTEDKTPAQAWNEHVGTFNRAIGSTLKKQWKSIKRDGPFVIFHATDEHVDDDKSALNILSADIQASHEIGRAHV